MGGESQSISHSAEEIQLLALLRDVQSVLAESINSLSSNLLTKPQTRYLGWAAVTVNTAAHGYLILRESYRIDAAKFLIRPIPEAVFASAAVMKKRGFLFRKAYTEILEEKKFYPQNSDLEADFEIALKELERLLIGDDPHCPIERKKVTVRETAEAAGMLPEYEFVYRTYCQFSHGTISAASGQLNHVTNNLDTQIVIRWVIVMLELLRTYTKAKVPDTAEFVSRLPAPQPQKNS